MNDVQVGDIQGNALVAQIGGEMHGDFAARDKNVYHIQSLTIYVSSRPAEPEPQAVAADIGPNPYKGLSAFQETDAERFFGREQLTRLLYDKFCRLHEFPQPTPNPSREGSYGKISTSEIPLSGGARGGSSLRLLAILGPSGSGKSSVARAGLVPELARHPLSGKQKARVAVFTPGVHPLEALATILARIATSDPTPVAKTREFAEELRREVTSPPTPLLQGEGNKHPLPLGEGRGEGYDGLRRIADVLPEIDAAPLILLIDQFEEIYSQCEQADERQQFLANLLCAAGDRSGHVSVILTLRSDFLGQTQSHPAFNHAIAAHEVLIPVMNDAELRQAIAEPAKRAGHPLDDATVELLIEQTKEREGALPLLQFALTKIWDGLATGAPPAETLKRIGGVGGALAGEAQRLFDRLSDADKAIARRAFLGLIQLGEGARDTRRRISLTEIVAQGEDAAHVQAVVRCFANPAARLVTLSANTDGTETAEVTHEALLDHWGTLKAWLDANRDDLRFHRHLAEDAKYWATQGHPDGLLWRPPDLDLLRQYHQRAGQDMTPLQVTFFRASVKKEQHSKRVKRLTIIAIIILAALSSVAAGVAFFAYREAKRQARVSLIRSLVAYALQDNMQNDRERAALLARHAYLLNQRDQGAVIGQIDSALRTILHPQESEKDQNAATLAEQVCQKVKLKTVLTPEEWAQFAGTDLPYEPACPELLKSSQMRLRSEAMTTDDPLALSLNLFVNGGVWNPQGGMWYPKRDVANKFEAQGEVIIDHATGLMWQKSSLHKYLTYEEAEAYIKALNDQKFAGYADWRLPTIEELLSLLKLNGEEQPNDLYPMFDKNQAHDRSAWSADREIKDGPRRNLAWFVRFDYGDVCLYNLNYSSYVRVVRSWQ